MARFLRVQHLSAKGGMMHPRIVDVSLPEHTKVVDTATRAVTGFIAVPTPDFGERGVDLAAAFELKARNVGLVERTRYRTEFPQGFDVTAESQNVRRDLYKHLVRQVDFVIVVLDRPSEGCVRIFSWASKLGVPTYAVQLPSARQSALLGAGPGEGPVTAEQRDDVEQALSALSVWQRRNMHSILAGDVRRAAAAQEHRAQKDRLAALWDAAGPSTRDLIGRRLDLPAAEVQEILDDPSLFAAASPVTRSRVDYTLTEAGRLALRHADSAGMSFTVRLDQLPESFVASMNDAIHEYDLERERVGELLMSGLRHESRRRMAELVGEPQRLQALTGIKAWGRLIEGLRRG
jgi:hypothetical protein